MQALTFCAYFVTVRKSARLHFGARLLRSFARNTTQPRANILIICPCYAAPAKTASLLIARSLRMLMLTPMPTIGFRHVSMHTCLCPASSACTSSPYIATDPVSCCCSANLFITSCATTTWSGLSHSITLTPPSKMRCALNANPFLRFSGTRDACNFLLK